MDKYDALIQCGNLAIVDAAMKCRSVLSSHHKPVVSISGGADSDVMLDLVTRANVDTEVTYAFFETGIEYDATKDHLRYLEDRYGIEIQTIRPVKSIPVCCHEYGLPFISKYVSQQLGCLQCHGFRFEDEPYSTLVKMYPNAPRSSIKWWTNGYGSNNTIYNIDRNPYLKDFIVENPPDFPISDRCCTYAKKEPAKLYMSRIGADLSVIGIRRAEGGVRQTVDSCFSSGSKYDTYRPLFWMSMADREEYEELFDVKHSQCYTDWGFTRTGCVGCPFDNDCESQLMVAESNEPLKARAANKVFGKSYEYTRKFRAFRAQRMIDDKERDESIRRKRSERMKRPIEQIDRTTGEVLARYSSQVDAQDATGIAQSSISSCIHGNRPSAGGFAWRFAETGEQET